MLREPTAFGKEIKKGLVEKNMTQAELASRIKTSPQYINNMIYGLRSGDKYRDEIMKVLEIQQCG